MSCIRPVMVWIGSRSRFHGLDVRYLPVSGWLGGSAATNMNHCVLIKQRSLRECVVKVLDSAFDRSIRIDATKTSIDALDLDCARRVAFSSIARRTDWPDRRGMRPRPSTDSISNHILKPKNAQCLQTINMYLVQQM